MTDVLEPNALGRRKLLERGLLLGGAAALAAPFLGTATANAAPTVDHTQRRRPSVILDIAMDGPTLLVNPGPNVDHGDLRGSTFYVEGPIYPGLTIPNEVDGWDTSAHTDEEIGRWFGMGQFMSFPGRRGPKLHSVHTYVLGKITADDNFPIDQFTSTGTEASATQDTLPSTRSITGGAGRYFAASGQITLYGNGNNTSSTNVLGVVGKAPNLRLFCYLADRRRL